MRFIVSPLFTSLNDFLRSRRVQSEALEHMEQNWDFWKSFNPKNFNYEATQSFVNELPSHLVLATGQM